jgi:hypothetical protein
VTPAQQACRFGSVNQFIIRERLAVAHRIGRPVIAVLPHQREQQA